MLYSFGDYTLDTEHYELHQAGRLVRLEPRVFTLVAYLVTHCGSLVTSEELKKQLWPDLEVVGKASLANAVAKARKALGDTGQRRRYIQTAHRRGYHFVAPVTARPPGAADLPTSLAPDTPRPQATPVLDQANAVSPLALGPPASPSLPPQTPRSYTPVHLAEKILTARSALEGERKQITVLFADLKGSLELLAGRDPEEARHLLDPVLERMIDAVHRYEGTVNQIMGDGIMTLFGAPLAHEDHAVRACYAALAMQEAIGRYAEELRQRQGLDAQIRVGLNSGEVVVRAIGNDLHMDYSAIGQTTHLAARLEQLAPPGGICMTAETLRLVEGYVQAKPLGPIAIKGLSSPVEVFELTGAEPTRTRLQAAATRILTPFVGRQLEFDVLRQSLELARAGQGQIVAVIGEPGVGKSRLFYEFTQAHHLQGWLILEAGAVSSYEKATPYLPIIDLLKAYFQIEGPHDGRGISEKVADKLLALDEALRPTLPAFLTLLDMPVEDPQWQALDPRQRRQRILDAVKRLLLRESQVQPLLVIVENLHWIDTETQASLDSLIESLPTARLLLLVNYRLEYQHGWGNKSYYTQLRLDPLPPAHAEELLQALLGRDASLQPLKRRLIERTEGNPFFLEESVWTLAETKALVGERGAYRLAQALPSIQVPTTVHAMLAARIDRLPTEDKHLLQAAAVIGKDVPFPLLQAIAEGPEEALRRSLAHLQTAEFLYEVSLFPELEYTFKHMLTHEVAYGSLLQERRRVLHSRIVEVIEWLYPDRRDEQVERLANHAFRGEVWEKAVAYFRQAGAKAFGRSANHEAVACFEQALTALQHLPESRDTHEQAIDLRFDLRHSLMQIGELGRVLNHLREAETLSRALDDQRRLGWVSDYMSNYFRNVGKYEEAVEAGERALAIAQHIGDFALQVAANFHLGASYQVLGDYHRGIDILSRAAASLEGELSNERLGLPVPPSIFCREWLIFCLAELGEFAEGLRVSEEAFRIAEVGNRAMDLAYTYRGVAFLYLRQGEVDKAIAMTKRGLRLCQLVDLPVISPWFTAFLSYAYALAGRIAEALPLLEQAAPIESAVPSYRALKFACLSDVSLLAGRMDDAIQFAERALELSRDRKERGHEAWALRLLGEIASRHNPPEVEPAESSYRQAMALAEELGMSPLMAHCHLGLGALYHQMAWLEQARSELSTAVEMYHAMEMALWLAPAQKMLALAK
jgi:class 3 adenylate cyclase/DNA-binding winged helix-turn-helix (wHTH) protein/tetratricopeptide (TPR) repeat protein